MGLNYVYHSRNHGATNMWETDLSRFDILLNNFLMDRELQDRDQKKRKDKEGRGRVKDEKKDLNIKRKKKL